MTLLSKPLTRETAATDRGIPIIITQHPRHLEFRLKGRRTRYTISIEGCYWLAIKRAVDAAREEKRKARKERQHERRK